MMLNYSGKVKVISNKLGLFEYIFMCQSSRFFVKLGSDLNNSGNLGLIPD